MLDTIVEKINGKLITNSKDVRRLRAILKDPVAKDCILSDGTSINDALEKLGEPAPPRPNGLAGDLGAIVASIRKHPWTALAELRGNDDAIRTIELIRIRLDVPSSLRAATASLVLAQHRHLPLPRNHQQSSPRPSAHADGDGPVRPDSSRSLPTLEQLR
ncbi:MAG: hypothetical protein E6J90_28015 [Deltaproteobacteria bacterium]|nr:MAG: hypothetical protein E6J90_28015 [Deltaproteobacteria bacterium]